MGWNFWIPGVPRVFILLKFVELVGLLSFLSCMPQSQVDAKPFQKQGQNSIVVLQVRKKALQISSMWRRVEEMEQVAKGTSGMLKQMQEKLEAMETETSQQRQRASDNEQELSRVRHDFGVLRISVDNLIKARETIHLLEKRIHEVEMLSERYHFAVTLPLIQF